MQSSENMVLADKLLDVGPGGRRCVCCFPAPGSKERRAQYRSAKRKEMRRILKEVIVMMNEDFEGGKHET